MQRDRLQKHRERIATVLAAEHEAARGCVQRGDKPRALLYLRRRKYQETLLQQTDGQLETLQQLTASIEFAQVEKDVLYGLRRGNDVLRQIQSEMSLEGVQKLMDDTAEGIRYQRAVSDMLAGGVLSNADEDDVEDQLDRIEREMAAAQAVPVCFLPPRPGRSFGTDKCAGEQAVVPELPSVPTTVPEATDEEKAQRAKARARERKAELQRAAAEEAMLAS